MFKPEYPPGKLDAAEAKAVQEISAKLARDLPLGPSDQARANLPRLRDTIRLAVIHEREKIGAEKKVAEEAAQQAVQETEAAETEAEEIEEVHILEPEPVSSEAVDLETPPVVQPATDPKPGSVEMPIGVNQKKDGRQKQKMKTLGDLSSLGSLVEPIEDQVERQIQESTTKVVKEMEDNIGSQINARIRQADMRMKKRIGDYARTMGLPTDERKHFEAPVVVERKVEKGDYKKIVEEAPPVDIPAGRRRFGFSDKNNISPDFGVQVEQRGLNGVVARYERVDNGEQSEAILNGKATKEEALRKNIYEKFRSGESLTPLQSELLNKKEDVRERVKKAIFLDKDNRERVKQVVERKRVDAEYAKDEQVRQIARDLIASKELSPEQKDLYKEKAIEARVKEMLASGITERDLLHHKEFGFVADKINKAYRELSTDVIDEDVADMMKKMGIEKTDAIKEYPDLFVLDKNKQVYVLHKIRQRVSEDAEFDAKEQFKADKAKKGFIGKIWKGMREYADTSVIKRNLIEKERKNGLAHYGEEMKHLVRHVKELPYDISYDKNGKILIQYENRDMTLSRPEFVDEFNEAATRLSEIPYEWSMPSATSRQRKEYAEALEAYEIKKKAIYTRKAGKFEVLSDEERELREDQALLWASQTEAAVRGNQLMTHSPELYDFDESSKMGPLTKLGKLQAAVPDFFKGFAGGVAARWATRKSTGAVFGVAGVMALGGINAWRRKEKEFLKREKEMRYGKGMDESGERLAGTKEASWKDTVRFDGNLEKRGIKNFMNAKTSAEKLTNLIGRIEKARTVEERDGMAEILKLRLQNMDEALKQGRVNFGAKKERGINRLKFFESMSRANQIVFMTDEAGEEYTKDLEGKLKRFYEARKKSDSDAQSARNQAKVRSFIVGAATVGVGAGVGALVADYIEETGSGQSYGDRLKEIVNDGGDGTWNDVPEGIQPHNERVISPEDGGVPVGSAYEDGNDELIDSTPDSSQQESSGSIPIFDDSPSDLESMNTEEGGGDLLAENTEPAPEAPTAAQYEIPSEIKQKLIMSPDGHIVGIIDTSKFESVKDFRNSTRGFLADMSKSGLPKVYQGDSWGMQTLSRFAPNEEKFLAFREVLANLPEDSEYAAQVRAQMVDLGETIRKDLAAYAKDKTGVETLGHFFKPYEEWIGASAVENVPASDLTASIEGAATPELPQAPETPVPAETPEPKAPVETAPVSSAEHFTRSMDANGNPNLKFDGEQGVHGDLAFIPDKDGNVIVSEKDGFYTDAGREFTKNSAKYINREQIEDMIANMKEAKVKFIPKPDGIVRMMEDYVDRKAIIDSGMLAPGSQEAAVLQAEMDNINSMFEKYSPSKLSDRFDGINSGRSLLSNFTEAEDDLESVETDAGEPEFKFITGIKIPTESKIIKEAEAMLGKLENPEPEGNIAVFKDGKVGFYAESDNFSKAQALAKMSASENGFEGKSVYSDAKMVGGKYRVLYVFKK